MSTIFIPTDSRDNSVPAFSSDVCNLEQGTHVNHTISQDDRDELRVLSSMPHNPLQAIEVLAAYRHRRYSGDDSDTSSDSTVNIISCWGSIAFPATATDRSPANVVVVGKASDKDGWQDFVMTEY